VAQELSNNTPNCYPSFFATPIARSEMFMPQTFWMQSPCMIEGRPPD
jgi:hypothetical protein